MCFVCVPLWLFCVLLHLALGGGGDQIKFQPYDLGRVGPICVFLHCGALWKLNHKVEVFRKRIFKGSYFRIPNLMISLLIVIKHNKN